MPADATLLGAAMLGALVLYALFGGADFGAGVWHLLATGRRAARHRQLIAHAIGPVWEANHVWLILVVVVLFTGFPSGFAELSIRLHAPLLGLLLAIVLRGSAFALCSAAGDRRGEARGWGWVFALASVCAPLLLGMTLGAVASGEVATPSALSFRGPWLSPFAMATGVLTLALFAFLAAAYLTLEAGGDAELREDFRRRALVTGVLAGGLALVTFLLSGEGAPRLRAGLTSRSWSVALVACTALVAAAALIALWTRRFAAARLWVAAQVALILLGWGTSQFPFLIAPSITLASASAPAVTQRVLLKTLAAGAIVLLPALWLLFRVFKARPALAGPERMPPRP